MSFFSTSARAAAVVLIAAVCSCGTLNKFSAKTSASAEIPKATLLGELLQTVDFPVFDGLDFSQEIANQGVREDQVDSVKVESFVIHTTEGSGQTMDFIDEVEFYAESDGLPKILVASSDAFKGKSSVTLTLEPDAELKPYIVAPSMTLVAQVKGTRPSQDTKLTADVSLAVLAAIPGCH